VLTALPAVCAAAFGSPRLAGRRFAVVGLGRVGTPVARGLAAAGAGLVVSDVDVRRRTLADELGAGWLSPDEALRAEVDVLVPAALGGVFTADTVPRLRCTAIAGPANNQLDEPATAELLHRRGILWAPDFVVGAGGVVYAIAVEGHHESAEQAAQRVAGIGDTVGRVLAAARRDGTSPAVAARRLARERVERAGRERRDALSAAPSGAGTPRPPD
jgi:leucine dehydrogenase